MTQQGTVTEVFLTFLRLGLTSFGGPIAHIGYFREAFVSRRKWLNEDNFADLLALCQFLPGPASSQMGFALGWMRAGPLGAVAAFVGFTLPSALVLILFAFAAVHLSGPYSAGALAGLKLVAVAIVAQAVLGMAHNLSPDRERAMIAVLSVGTLTILPAPFAMPVAILAGMFAGWGLGQSSCSDTAPLPFGPAPTFAVICLALFAGLLVITPILAPVSPAFAIFDGFYRAGAMVFGGGHVVLPLLKAELVPNWLTQSDFLAGYGATQAVPGPLFTFAAYLGATIGGWSTAALALSAVFLPGFLLLIGVLPFWSALRRYGWAQSAMQGANAAVVGILGAALYDPLFTTAVHDMQDFALTLFCFTLLTAWKSPPWIVVLTGVLGGVFLVL